MVNPSLKLAVSLLLAVLILPACVSSTLETSQFRPVGTPQQSTAVTGSAAVQEQSVATDTATPVAPVETTVASNQPVSLTPNSPLATIPAKPGKTKNGSTQEQSVAGETAGVPSEADRQRGIAEIRNKAAGMPNVKPTVGPIPATATQPMTPEQQQQIAAELQGNLTENAISDAEIESKAASILWLRKKAQSHYDEAVSGIAK
jgi:hypothetical protein